MNPIQDLKSLLEEDAFENEPRPPRMKAPKPVDRVQLWKEDRPIDYGDCQALFVEKYGKERGEKTFQDLFVVQGSNFGWSLASKIQKEKVVMLDALGKSRPSDLHDVHYWPLWKEWMEKVGNVKPTSEDEQSQKEAIKKTFPTRKDLQTAIANARSKLRYDPDEKENIEFLSQFDTKEFWEVYGYDSGGGDKDIIKQRLGGIEIMLKDPAFAQHKQKLEKQREELLKQLGES